MAEGYTRANLDQLLCEVFQIEHLTPLLDKQVNTLLVNHDMTPKEIGRCIVYVLEVEKGSFGIIYGIQSSVLSVREKANKYFTKLALDQQRRELEAQKVAGNQDNIIVFNINSLKHKKRTPKQFDIGEIDVSDEGGSNGNH